ncbi:cell division protein FtsQ [Filimonas lacunae]|uniref:Cell division protein FtsQ n=2 Tax=Filimonas lacunae TaxID=477680 RepID=A0A173MS49_9BACT|nr:cell division protein FtsQ [Filimonas lacunae]SIT16730.1 cell division protein FtsQ [Filimonas lacunae]
MAWCVLGLLTTGLLVAGVQKKNSQRCKAVHIEIEGAEEHVFVDEKHLLALLAKNGAEKGVPVNSVMLRRLEARVEKDVWIKNAELFFDNNRVLQVKIEEREPLARVFTIEGSSFYIDSSGTRLPLSDRLTARVPVFTSFPGEKAKLSATDSIVLQEVKKIAQTIGRDSFWTDLVAQVDITPQRTYQIIPQLGNQVIELGSAENLDDKLDRLYSFYKQVWAKAGFEKYEKIDVQYAGQVVATRRGVSAGVPDSARAIQQLNNSIAQATGLSGGSAAVQAATANGNRRDTTAAAGNRPARPAAAAPKPRAVMQRRH